jgi:O-acetyl-ADP-ribose deacetylase (regulator of RNase III)
VKISIFVGDIVDVPAEAVCTSTNPRLSLMMGTGAAVREKGGFEILRACEELIEVESRKSGNKFLRAGSAHVTVAGKLPFKAVIHCVASDASHLSSSDIVRTCAKNALIAADHASCRSVAMPVFASGHARVKFDRAVQAMAEAIRDSQTSVEEVAIVVLERERAEEVRRIVDAVMNGP